MKLGTENLNSLHFFYSILSWLNSHSYNSMKKACLELQPSFLEQCNFLSNSMTNCRRCRVQRLMSTGIKRACVEIDKYKSWTNRTGVLVPHRTTLSFLTVVVYYCLSLLLERCWWVYCCGSCRSLVVCLDYWTNFLLNHGNWHYFVEK